MNKFTVFSCVIPKDQNNVPYVVLTCVSDPGFALFFPVTEEVAAILKYIIDGNGEYDFNTRTLGIYKTMLDSWKASDHYLSGILMDLVYDKNIKEDILSIRLVISNQNTGELESTVMVNFVHAIMLSALEKVNILINEDIIFKMIPSNEKKEDKIQNKHFPEDDEILNIARKIMSGEIKNNKNSSDKKEKSS